jgi:hypothetical protein
MVAAATQPATMPHPSARFSTVSTGTGFSSEGMGAFLTSHGSGVERKNSVARTVWKGQALVMTSRQVV